MAIIKVPSSKIYDIGAQSRLISQQINKVESTSDNYTAYYSENVLEKEYIINFYEVQDSGLVYVGNNPQKTDIVFSSEPRVLGNYLIIDSPTIIDLNIEKLIRFKLDSTEGIHEYPAHIENQWSYNGSSFENENLIVFPTYNDDNYSFKLDIGKPISDGNQYKNYIVVGFRGFSGEPFQYIISTKIKVAGVYYDKQQVNQVFGVPSSPNIVALPNNELNQIGNKIFGNHAQQEIATNLIRKYNKGKETYTIKCSAGEYYDINGRKAIDPYDTSYPAIFKMHDEIEPYVFTSRGEVPLSEKADGSPKQFEIIGIDYSYKGVVWQELTLQEYIE